MNNKDYRESIKPFEVEVCKKFIEKFGKECIFSKIMEQSEIPLYDCSKERFAAMCLCVVNDSHKDE